MEKGKKRRRTGIKKELCIWGQKQRNAMEVGEWLGQKRERSTMSGVKKWNM